MSFSTDLHKTPPVSNSTKIRPVGAVLIYADRRMGIMKLRDAFPITRTCLKVAQSLAL